MSLRDSIDDPYVQPDVLRAANARHDAELRAAGVDLFSRVRSAWNPAAMVRRGQLTDKQIRSYEKRGFYDPEFKAARKKLWQKKARKGNFIETDGRLIYSPL